MEKKGDNKLTQIVLELKSDDAKKNLKAVKTLEAYGDSSVIKILADKLLQGSESKVEAAILELLSSLKDTSVVVEIMDVLGNKRFAPIRQKILTTIWNTKVDFSGYIDEFVHIATTGDFMESLDCLTIIENMEGPFMEEDILECLLHLKNYLENDQQNDEQKAQILSEIAMKIKDINRSLMD